MEVYVTVTPIDGDTFKIGPARSYDTADGCLSINMPDDVTKLFPLVHLREITIKVYTHA